MVLNYTVQMSPKHELSINRHHLDFAGLNRRGLESEVNELITSS